MHRPRGRSRNRPGGGSGRHGAHCEQRAPQKGGKSLASMGLDPGSILSTPVTQDPSTAMKSMSDPEPLSYVKPQPNPEQDMAYSPWGVRSQGDRPPSPPWSGHACQDMVDHIVPPGYFSKLRHLPNADFLIQYNINLARSKIARRDQRIQVREEEIKKLDQEIKSLKTVETEVHDLRNQAKNLEILLEAEVDMNKVTKAKNVGLAKELESLRAQFAGLQRCAEMDARLDKLSVDFDEELYPHMMTAIASHRWVIGHGLRLSVMKCVESSEIRHTFADVVSTRLAKGMSEDLKYGKEHRKAGRDLADIEAYDPEANSKLVKALQDLKDLKYPIVDQLEGLKDAPIELIITSLHLESDTGEDAP
ncbi:hypothetical protein Tco_1182405 [Tanacetum coccineum]